MEFTKNDHLILERYKTLIDGLADYMGPGYEFVLHSLEDLERSVIHIINGEYTGRKVGSPITDLALNMLRKMQEQDVQEPYISYYTKNKAGDPLKATTITIAGESGRIIGLLCINFYLNTPLSSLLDNMFPDQPTHREHVPESFADNIDELLQNVYQESLRKVRSGRIANNLQNKEIISVMYDQGIFKIKDSVNKVADIMKISKNTVYMHLRNIKESKETTEA